MSTTVKYKGATLTTVTNQTKTLLTSGTWLEDDIELTDSVPAAQMSASSGMIYGAPTITVDANGLIYSTWDNYGSPTSIYPIAQDGWATTSDSSVVYGDVTGSLQLTTKSAATYYPSGSDQTISSGQYLTGVQTIKGVTTSNLIAGNIKNGVTVQVGDSADPDRVLSVTGTYTGGTSKNAQTAQSTSRSTSSTYTEVITLTCSKAGTYDVYWSTFRSSTSGTWGSQLYLNDSAYGSAQTGSWSNHIQNIHLSNVQITANAEVAVRVRTRGNNYYGYVGTLTIIEA